MLNKNIVIISVGLSLLFAACKKEDTKNVSTVLKVPTLELVGDEFMSVPIGGAYTDAGAKYMGEDGSVATIQAADNHVNTAQPGLYVVTYSKKSASGIFTTEAQRIVAVTYQDDPTDYSGTYLRTTTGVNAYVTKLAPGLYKVQNPGGAVGHGAVTVYFIETALGHFEGPPQTETAGGVGDIEITNIAFTNTGATWRIINNPYYGTGLRTFVKQ